MYIAGVHPWLYLQINSLFTAIIACLALTGKKKEEKKKEKKIQDNDNIYKTDTHASLSLSC